MWSWTSGYNWKKLAAHKDTEVPEELAWLLQAMVDQQFQQAAVTYVEKMEDVWSKEENLIYKTLVFLAEP
ncbi:hypothetical protein ACFTAO_50370 [Paenibacillus rhizoplanae]